MNILIQISCNNIIDEADLKNSDIEATPRVLAYV